MNNEHKNATVRKMLRDIESQFLHQCQKYDTEMEVFNLQFSWTINSIENFDGKHEETFSPHSDKHLSWCLSMGDSIKAPDYYYIYLTFSGGLEFKIRSNVKFILMDDRGEVKVKIEPTVNLNKIGRMGSEKFVQKTFLHNLVNKSKVKILCELNYIINNSEFPSAKDVLTKIHVKNEWCQNFKQLLDTKRFSDVTITVGEKQFTAHKAILAARSSVFAAMFEDKMMESDTNNVVITDIDCDVFEEVLNYIYTTRTSKLEVMAQNLLAAADKYSLNSLKSLCERELSAKLSLDTALDILIFADLHNAVTLKADAIKFINNNPVEIMKTEQWEQIKRPHSHLIVEAYEDIAMQANKKCKTCKEDE